MLKRIKRWTTRAKCAIALFLLRNMGMDTSLEGKLEEYIEKRQLLLSSWTRELDPEDNETRWYKLATYLDSSFDMEQVYHESDRWSVIHYLMEKDALFEFTLYGFSFVFNRSGRIRHKGSIDAGSPFFIVKDAAFGAPYICIIDKDVAVRDFFLDRLFVLLSKGEIEKVIQVINMYCEIHHMYLFNPDLKIWSFGMQEFIHNIPNDGLYISDKVFWRDSDD